MTTGIQQRSVSQTGRPVLMDRADPARLAKPSQEASSQSFWASQSRWRDSDVDEVLEVNLGSPRLINQLKFKISRFPCTVLVEYEKDGIWKPFEYALDHRQEVVQAREITQVPVRLLIAESVPPVVETYVHGVHPQHHGVGHWRKEDWATIPVSTAKVRFVLRRLVGGTAPTSKTGAEVPYSLAVKDLQIGYRVTSEGDLPKGLSDGEPFESSKDLLGSTVFYSVYRQRSAKAIDGSDLTYWRSEPQPVNYAVVPLYLDMRDSEGAGQVVDKFYVDPTSGGVSVNLYFSNEEPSGEFIGESQPIPGGARTEIGGPERLGDLVRFKKTTPVGVSLDPSLLRLDVGAPWWLGLEGVVEEGDFSDPHPILSIGPVSLEFVDSSLRISTPGGSRDILLPPTHVPGVTYTLALSYHPRKDLRPPYARLVYASRTYLVEESVGISVNIPSGQSVVSFGSTDAEAETGTAISIRAAVLKSELLSPETEAWFLDEGLTYVEDDQTYEETDRHTNINALLRMAARWVTNTNIFGLVGGDGDRIGNNVWNPVNRDFVLRKGYMEFPPIKAKYWKFEFSNLSPVIYENFQTIDRQIFIFPPSVVRSGSREGTREFLPHGTETTVRQDLLQTYLDAVQGLRASGATPEKTSALVVNDPAQASRAAQTGWIWQYQPWHLGSFGAGWTSPSRHFYEQISIRHQSKVAFFVGIKELKAFLTDYTIPDDTDEYWERFYSVSHIDDEQTSGAVRDDLGWASISAHAQVTSISWGSYQAVRAVQFSTMQTGPIQLLPDPEFLSEDGLVDYVPYGDVVPERIEARTVRLRRGYVVNGYENFEDVTYGVMEEFTYRELEGLVGNDAGDVSADGGIATRDAYIPLGDGEITGKVIVSSEVVLGGPVVLEIVAGDNGVGTVVATSSEHNIVAHGLSEITVTYAPNSRVIATDPDPSEETTYGQLEEYEYQALEDFTYGVLEAIPVPDPEEPPPVPTFERLSLRLRQEGGFTDEFFVHKMALYDDPIAWSFSNDDGETWYRAIGVRNDPWGVLTFPEANNQLRYRFEISSEGASVTALNIRPWYGSRNYTAEATHDLERSGAMQSQYDHYPSLEHHPIWRMPIEPVDFEFIERSEPFFPWRNLAPNPGGEGPAILWETSGGTAIPSAAGD